MSENALCWWAAAMLVFSCATIASVLTFRADIFGFVFPVAVISWNVVMKEVRRD